MYIHNYTLYICKYVVYTYTQQSYTYRHKWKYVCIFIILIMTSRYLCIDCIAVIHINVYTYGIPYVTDRNLCASWVLWFCFSRNVALLFAFHLLSIIVMKEVNPVFHYKQKHYVIAYSVVRGSAIVIR